MVDVSIKNTAGQTFTFQDGDIWKVSSDGSTQVDITPMPGAGPADSIGIDLGGCQKVITVIGGLTLAASTRVSGDTVTSILDQKRWIEALADGMQEALRFKSNYEEKSMASGDGTKANTDTYVIISRYHFDEEEGSPSLIPFMMVLKVIAGP